MELAIGLFYILFFFVIPAGLLLIAVKVYGDGMKFPVIAAKLLLSFIAHFVVSYFSLAFVVVALIGVDPKPNSPYPGLATQTVCLLIVIGYGFLGWLLCSFVNGKLIKSYKAFNLHSEKPQSIFSNKYHG